MPGWNGDDSSIQVDMVEEIVDTNPDLYKQRTIVALNEKRYSDAINEAQTAIKYGNKVLEYQVLLSRTLFEKGEYQECFQYIKSSGLWDYREDDALLYDEQDYIISCYYACCLVLADTKMLAGLTWEVYHENKKLILLLEILMENHWKKQYEIKTGTTFLKSIQQVQAMYKGNFHCVNSKDDLYEIIQIPFAEQKSMNQIKTKGNMEAAVKEMMGKFTDTCTSVKETVKVRGGETKEDYLNRMEDSVGVMHGALSSVLDTVAELTGFYGLQQSIYDIIDAGCDGKTSKKDLFKMAQKCRERIDEEIEFLMELGEEEDFRKAIALKAINGEGKEFTKSIFESFVGGCVWIGLTVSSKLRKWCKNDNESLIFGAICKKLADFTRLLKSGVKIVLNPVELAFSFVIAGVIKAVEMVHPKTILNIFARQNNWKIICNERFSKRNMFADELECQYLLKELEGGLEID